MKKRIFLLTIILTALAGLCGCGNAAGVNTQNAMAQIQSMQYTDALVSLETAMIEKENPQQIFRAEGIAYIGLTDYENAVVSLEKALTYAGFRPDDIEYDINYYLAIAYYKAGRIDDAIGVYRAIVNLEPKAQDAWYLMGSLELEKGNQEQAVTCFDKALSINPSNYDLLINIYQSAHQYGYDEIAREKLEAVLADDKAKLSDYNLGRICFYLGDFEQARVSLEKARETGNAQAAALLGQTYVELHDYNYAASVYNSYIENRQPDASIYNQLGLCRLKMEDYRGALDAFEAGLALEDTSAAQSLRFNQITAYEHLGQFDQAKILLQSYLTNYPDDAAAVREMEFLQSR